MTIKVHLCVSVVQKLMNVFWVVYSLANVQGYVNLFLYHYIVADVTKDKVQCFLNRICAVYSNIDSEIIHGNQIGLYSVVDCRHEHHA